MAKVRQYPHWLFLFISAEARLDERGRWRTDASATLSAVSRCREEVSSGDVVQLASGEYHTCTSVIYAPGGTPHIQEGSTVVVSADEAGQAVRIKGIVRKCDVSQLHTRIWL